MIEVEDSGENTIVVIAGANAQLSPEDVDAAAEAIGRSSVLVVQLEIPLSTVARAIQVARSHGVTVLLNPAPALALEPSVLQSVDVLVANAEEIGALSGLGAPLDPRSSGRLVVDAGARAVVVTLGAEGAVVLTKDGQWDIPAFRVNPVDTTGAGDAFVGNLAHALDTGQSLLEAARFASAAAAASVQRLGAQPSMPTRRESEAVLGSRPL
jgi:ribokinase